MTTTAKQIKVGLIDGPLDGGTALVTLSSPGKLPMHIVLPLTNDARHKTVIYTFHMQNESRVLYLFDKRE